MNTDWQPPASVQNKGKRIINKKRKKLFDIIYHIHQYLYLLRLGRPLKRTPSGLSLQSFLGITWPGF
uniref:Uncharacterized protein n=1 Tax=Salix viminalis TaxID=40686 RepID=A0A6N2KW05_SALVM